MKEKFTRRDFLKAVSACSAARVLGLAIRPRNAWASTPIGINSSFNFRVLVKIEFLGGCDSHGIWLPTESNRFNALKARRQNAMFAQNVGGMLDIGYGQGIGLHPNLAPLIPHIPHARFFMNTSNALSYGQTGSHEDAQNIMTMGTREFSGKFEGWTARIFDSEPNCQLLGFLGSRGANLNCDRNSNIGGNHRCADAPPTTVDTFENFRFDGANLTGEYGGSNNSKYVADVLRRLAEARPAAQQPSTAIGEMSAAMRGAIPAMDEIAHTASFHSPRYNEYNSNDKFAVQLRNVASKIKQLTVEPSNERFIFSLGMGGFDVHDLWNGNEWAPGMPGLMTSFGSAVGTFLSDMQSMGTYENVVLMTSTEFGRTLASNGVGTDHGSSSTTMVLGGKVKGGGSAVFGQMLSASEFANLYVPPSYIDNRGIISSVLNDFMGIDHTKAFPGPIASEFIVQNYDLFT
jgi:uncharacterized protein (DUF1501 family)